MDCSIHIDWMSRLIILGVSGIFMFDKFFFIEIAVNFITNGIDPDQTPRLRRLIWVCTVCHCPIYGTLGINGFGMGILSA